MISAYFHSERYTIHVVIFVVIFRELHSPTHSPNSLVMVSFYPHSAPPTRSNDAVSAPPTRSNDAVSAPVIDS
jgi:hypothetical protein